MRRLFLFLLFLFLLFLVTPTPAEKIEVKFNVDPPNAEVYRLGVAEDVYNGGPEYLGIADQGSVQDKEKFTTSPRMQFLFKAKGYKDLRTTLDVSHVENETGTVLLPSAEVIRLDPLGKSYIPLALVLMGLAIGTGGFLFLRARNQRVEDIGSWVEDHKVTTAERTPLWVKSSATTGSSNG